MDISKVDIVNDWQFVKEYRDEYGREYTTKGRAFQRHIGAGTDQGIFMNFRTPRTVVHRQNLGEIETMHLEPGEVVNLHKIMFTVGGKVKGVSDSFVRFRIEGVLTNSKVSRNSGVCILTGDLKSLQNL